MRELTPKQQQFVSRITETGCTPTEAARYVGFSMPRQEAYRQTRKPHVAAAISAGCSEAGIPIPFRRPGVHEFSNETAVAAYARRLKRLRGPLADLALDTMETLAFGGEGISKAVQKSAAEYLLNAAGHSAKEARPSDDEFANLNEMTNAQLEAFIAKTERAMAEGGEAPVITVIDG